MKFSKWLENTANNWILNTEVPMEPGTKPISANHVRLYHYTKVRSGSDEDKHAAAENLRKIGLDIKESRGHTYGEPNVVWASTAMPSLQKVFAEFSIAMNDPRWMQGKPQPGMSSQEYESLRWDCYFGSSILPQEIIAVHEPWHGRYRYILESGLMDDVKAGKYDYLLDTPEYAPAIIKAKSM